MKNKANPQNIQHENHQYKYTPVITTVAMPLLIGRRKKMENVEQSAQENPSKVKPRPKGIIVTKYELSDGVLKFYVAKGLFKKRWVTIKEIPVNEITGVEGMGNELTVTWKGDAYSFVIKKGDLFSKLRDQIQGLLDEQRKILESNDKATLRRSDLAELINTSVSIVDLLFDVLIDLQVKTVDWSSLETYANSLGENSSFAGQTMAPLSLDFSKVTKAIKSKALKKASKETFNVLKSIYDYFDNLNLEEDLQEAHPSFEEAKAVILAYYTLNDLLLGKIVGENDAEEEILVLETVLQDLAKETNFKVNVEALKGCIDKVGVESDNQAVIGDVRGIFRDQLKQL
jgi:hypothetical protein